MTVKAARATLAVSILIYAAALAGMAAEYINPDAGMLASLVAMAGMVVSSIACLLLWAKGRFRRK